MTNRYLFVIVLFLLFSCKENQHTDSSPLFVENLAADGFDTVNSDRIAIALADSVMKAQGGRSNWDASRFFTWNFFGNRKLWWDKQTGDVRIESFRTDLKVLVNINTMQGKVFINGEIQSNTDTISKYLEVGKEIWINDSYWLFMPFKLKDSGVTLKYIGGDSLLNGNNAEVLQLTFKATGVTPNNKYLVYINPKSYLVEQWSYFETNTQINPDFITPWSDYKQYGKILLAGFRGERDGIKRELSEIQVLDSLPNKMFTDF